MRGTQFVFFQKEEESLNRHKKNLFSTFELILFLKFDGFFCSCHSNGDGKEASRVGKEEREERKSQKEKRELTVDGEESEESWPSVD